MLRQLTMMDLHSAGVGLLGAKGTLSARVHVANWWISRGERRAMKAGIEMVSATSSCTQWVSG